MIDASDLEEKRGGPPKDILGEIEVGCISEQAVKHSGLPNAHLRRGSSR